MTAYTSKFGLLVDERLVGFVEEKALPGTGVAVDHFWQGLAGLMHDLAPKNRALLAKRDNLQAKLDEWHIAHRGRCYRTE